MSVILSRYRNLNFKYFILNFLFSFLSQYFAAFVEQTWNHYLSHPAQVFSNRSTLRITQINRPCLQPTTTTPTPPPHRPTHEFSSKLTIVTRRNFRAVGPRPPTRPELHLRRCNSVHFRFQMLVPEIEVRPSTSGATLPPSFRIGVNIF